MQKRKQDLVSNKQGKGDTEQILSPELVHLNDSKGSALQNDHYSKDQIKGFAPILPQPYLFSF